MAIVAAALSAAVLAHVGIDIAGDYLLRDDSYDHVAHGSRGLVSSIALLCAGGAGALFFRDLFATLAARSSRIRLTGMPRAAIAAYVSLVPVLALTIVPLMETIDTLRAGGDVDSLADAFGGSLLLGGATTLLCAAMISALLVTVVAWLCGNRERVARLVVALLERKRSTATPAIAMRSRIAPARTASTVRPQRRGKRAPPARARILSFS